AFMSSKRYRRVSTRSRTAPSEYKSLSKVGLSPRKTSGAENRMCSSDSVDSMWLRLGSVNLRMLLLTKILDGFIAPCIRRWDCKKSTVETKAFIAIELSVEKSSDAGRYSRTQ